MNSPPSQRARELAEKIAENSFYYVITRPDNYRERITLIIAPLIQQAFDEELAVKDAALLNCQADRERLIYLVDAKDAKIAELETLGKRQQEELKEAHEWEVRSCNAGETNLLKQMYGALKTCKETTRHGIEQTWEDGYRVANPIEIPVQYFNSYAVDKALAAWEAAQKGEK